MIRLALKCLDSAWINGWVQSTGKLCSSPSNFSPIDNYNTCSTKDELLRWVEALESQVSSPVIAEKCSSNGVLVVQTPGIPAQGATRGSKPAGCQSRQADRKVAGA